MFCQSTKAAVAMNRNAPIARSASTQEREVAADFGADSRSRFDMQSVGVESYQNALDLYVAIAVPILFKYDITFDKMIGDAIMGFSNEPAKRMDYIARMGAACLEIRDTMAARDDEMMCFWGRPFELKMGLANGPAKVGFQGQIVRSYTATGMVTGIATAMMDSSPIVCITGQVGSKMLGSDAFQEIDRKSVV